MTAEWQDQELGALFEFSSGKSIAPGGDGLYPAFGSNGLIGQAEKSLFDGGIIIGRVGAYCGSTAISTSPFWASDNTIVARPKDGIDLRFGYYLLSNAELNRHAGGAAQPLLTQATLKPLRFPVPSLTAQRRIGSILGAYDDLIEVNRRRIALLEEMARRLFEEWFVRFRFPGHEGHKMVETPDGPLPEGWKFGTAAELIDFDPTTKIPRDGRKPFVPMNSLSTDCSLIGEIEWREGNSGAKFANGDTLFARITPCLENGKTGLVRNMPGGGLGFGSTEFLVMRGKLAGAAFCYQLARHPAFREHARRSMSGATGRQRARTESLRAYQLAIPPSALLLQFEAVSWPLLELSGSLGNANERLASSRDLLLPRLISGELSVSTAERELEAVT